MKIPTVFRSLLCVSACKTSDLDAAVLAQMRSLAPHPQLFFELYKQFLKKTHEQLQSLKTALDAMDKETCLFLLHGMKSSARQIGASSLGNELERSETLLGQSPDASTIELHERLLLSLEECQGAINEVLQREKRTE